MWKPIVGFESSYEISEYGSIRRLKDDSLVPQRKHEYGYWIVDLRLLGKSYTKTVHSLVALTFIGPRPKGMQVRHLNGNPEDTSKNNLAYGTPKQNAADKIGHGTQVFGEDNYNSKLKEADIVSIRERRAAGEKLKAIGDSYGVGETYIHHICIGEKWARAGGPITPKSRRVNLLSESQQEEALKMRSEGMGYKRIAQHFETSVTQIWNLVKANESQASN